MKKPTYMCLQFPARKGTFAPAVKKYFKLLESKVLKINFGKKRYKKLFEYKIISTGLQEGWYHDGTQGQHYFEVSIEQEPPNKE